jgi:hypothetical protein
MKQNWKLLFGIFCGLVLVAVGVLHTLEKVPYTEHQPPSAEAQRNRMLAAQRTLDRLDVGWSEIRGLPTELPAGAGVAVIWPYNRGSLPRYTLDAVADFVASGGHLIVEAGWWSQDPMLERFGVHREDALSAEEDEHADSTWQQRDEEADDSEELEDFEDFEDTLDPHAGHDHAEDEDASCACSARAASSLLRSGSLLGTPEVSLRISEDDWLRSTEPLLGVIGDPQRPKLIHLAHGEGRVTVLLSLDPFSNGELGDADHAEVLLRLINLPQPLQRVLFVRAQPGGFGDWLVEYAWRVLLVGAVLLGLALWMNMPRLGPLAADPAARRRRLLDHLLASGRLLWTGGAQGVLASAAAESALARVRSEFPHTRWLPPPELAEFLQRRLQIDPAVTELLLAPQQIRHTASLTTLVRACARIHRELSPMRASRATNPLYDH